MVDAIWAEALQRLRGTLSEQHFETWVAPLRAVAWNGAEVQLEVPNGFFRDWVKRYHLRAIEDAVRQVAGATAAVRLEVNRALDRPTTTPRPTSARPRAKRVEPAPPPGDPRYTFDTFVVGESNQVAHDAARAVAERPGTRFNPLFLYGGVGLGKTHLLKAVTCAAAAARGADKVLCLSAENFVNELIDALKRERMDAFRRRFRRIETLIVDDIQFLGGKVRSQEEFTHTFNALHGGGRQIILASDRAPHELPGIEDALRSRFASGLLVDVRPPDPALRLALVRRKALALWEAPEEAVIVFLADHWCENGRQLEGAIARVDAFATLSGRPVTIALAREALRAFTPVRTGRPTLDRIVGEVCLAFKVTRAEITSRRRTARVALPRQVAMYLCRRHTDVPLHTIGAGLGGRDHSTVVHGLAAIEGRLRDDGGLRAQVASLEARLTA
ncbi:MAG: chromosomal replication initiator protein DnaA [Candidatus Binatia bacterium]